VLTTYGPNGLGEMGKVGVLQDVAMQAILTNISQLDLIYWVSISGLRICPKVLF